MDSKTGFKFYNKTKFTLVAESLLSKHRLQHTPRRAVANGNPDGALDSEDH